MAEESLSTMAKKSLIKLIINSLYPLLVSIIIPMVLYLYSKGEEIISHTKYKEYSLLLLSILLGTTILFLILWVRLYWRYGKFFQACGVLWDKDFRMHCFSCHKPLKYSSTDPSILNCSDRKCDNKHVLKDRLGQKITEQQAIELIKQSQQGVRADR
jgi:hypothetical protein